MREPTTAQKIAMARAARAVTMLGRRLVGAGDRALVVRRGVRWELDLREGIDFAIYLLGGFELRTLRIYEELVHPGDTVLDIGANIGAHTLPFARLVGSDGRVIAFEPTRFAFTKLERNLSLNQDLAARVLARQIALVDGTAPAVPERIYSSWPLDRSDGRHAVHGGVLQGTEGAQAMTLDRAAESIDLDRVDFIKLDVDGHEPAVLAGGLGTIARFRPRMLIEWAPYLFEGRDAVLNEALRGLRELGYRARIAGSQAVGELPCDRNSLFVPIAEGASVNLLLEVGP